MQTNKTYEINSCAATYKDGQTGKVSSVFRLATVSWTELMKQIKCESIHCENNHGGGAVEKNRKYELKYKLKYISTKVKFIRFMHV